MNNQFQNIAVQPLDSSHIANTLSCVPASFHGDLLSDYEHKYTESRRDANLGLLAVQDYARGKTFLNYEDETLRKKADRLAHLAHSLYVQGGINSALTVLHDNSVAEPESDNEQALKARITNEKWWLDQLLKKHDQQYEETAIKFGLVRKHKQPYVSTNTLNKIIARHKRSLETMSRLEAVNDEGETIDMLDVLKASMANPEVQRAELMTRLNGFEEYATKRDHAAEFYTLTAPSKYHPSSSKYQGATPAEVQKNYFTPLWAKIRAKLKKQGLNVYGFRIAEPHADSCVHWHMLLFMPKNNTQAVRAILKDYALREDGKEKGAAKHRFTVESIDASKGSAVGYIAKYISKNIDGFGMEGEADYETGNSASDSAKRVKAWASVWRIRQFQQIGGASVGIWRELRRIESPVSNPIIEAARQAADKGDWCEYLEAMGGCEIEKKDHLIKTARDIRTDIETGEIQLNQYGELVEFVKGISTGDCLINTRLQHWTIQEKAEFAEDKTPVSNAPTAEENATAPAFDLPWCPVGNCRKPQSGGLNHVTS